MEFKPIKNSKVYEQVIDQIKQLIYEGKIKRGDRLPSERKLKEQLNVSRASIREAFSALEMIGLIESRHGEGTFIKTSPDKNILEPLSIILMLEESSVEDLIELRRVLEVDSVRLAAERRTEKELREIEGYIEKLANSSGFEEKSVEADEKFHYTIARSSKNKALYYTMISISELIDYQIYNIRTKLVSQEKPMQIFLAQHKLIYEAIKSKDSKQAIKAMKDHLDYVEGLTSYEIKE